MERYTLGSTARLFLDLITGGAGSTGETPTIAIRRRYDNKWWDATEEEWADTLVVNAMTELDAANEPGRYYFDFDQTVDEETGSTLYTARFNNAGDLLEYRDLAFGPMAAVSNPSLCSIQGSVFSLQGQPVPNVVVRVTPQLTYTDSLGRSIEADVLETRTITDGSFDIPLVRGMTVRLEIGSIGYDRKVVVPDAASILFTDL